MQALYSFTGTVSGLARAMRRYETASKLYHFAPDDAKRLAELKDSLTIVLPICLVLLAVSVSGLVLN